MQPARRWNFFNKRRYGNRLGIARGGSNREESRGQNRYSDEIRDRKLISNDFPDTITIWPKRGVLNIGPLFLILDSQKQLVAKHVQILVLSFQQGGAGFFPIGVKCSDAGFFIYDR